MKRDDYFQRRLKNPKHRAPLDYLKARAEKLGDVVQCNRCAYYGDNGVCSKTGAVQFELGLCLKWDPKTRSVQVNLNY